MPGVDDLLTTAQVISVAGVTRRQLQWWDEKGYVPAAFHKADRRYTRRQARIAQLLVVMSSGGRDIAPIASQLSGLTDLQLNECRYAVLGTGMIRVTGSPEEAISAAVLMRSVDVFALPKSNARTLL